MITHRSATAIVIALINRSLIHRLFQCHRTPLLSSGTVYYSFSEISRLFRKVFFDSAPHFLSVFAEKKLLTNLGNRVKWESYSIPGTRRQ